MPLHPLIHNSKSTILVYMVLNGIEHLTGCGPHWLSLVSFLVKVPVALDRFGGNWQYCKGDRSASAMAQSLKYHSIGLL